jgi:hypothetical protein
MTPHRAPTHWPLKTRWWILHARWSALTWRERCQELCWLVRG